MHQYGNKMKNLLIILSFLSLVLAGSGLFAQCPCFKDKSGNQHFAPVFVHPARIDKEYNTHGVYAGLFLKDNEIKSNGIHASIISIGNTIKVNGIHGSLFSADNNIQVNGIHASLISIGNDIKVNGVYSSLISIDNEIKVNGIYANLISFNDEIEINGLYLNLLEISDQISLINARFPTNFRFLGIVSFTGLALGPRISLAQLSIGRFNVGIVNTNLGRGSRGLGVLNFNVNCKIPISPIIGRGCRERRKYFGCGPIW